MGPLLPDGARYELNDVIRATEQRMSCICMYVCMYIYIYIYIYICIYGFLRYRRGRSRPKSGRALNGVSPSSVQAGT